MTANQSFCTSKTDEGSCINGPILHVSAIPIEMKCKRVMIFIKFVALDLYISCLPSTTDVK